MVSDALIHGLVGEAREGSDPALERLVQLFLEAEEIRGWARRRAQVLSDNALQQDEVLSFVQDTVWHAACDEAGGVRWDEARQVPFGAWVLRVVRTRHISRAVRYAAAEKRTPQQSADYYGISFVQKSPESGIVARMDVGLYVSELRKAGKVSGARVLELLAMGLSVSDVAYELFGEATTNRSKVVSAIFCDAKVFCRKRAKSHGLTRIRHSRRDRDCDSRVVPTCAP